MSGELVLFDRAAQIPGIVESLKRTIRLFDSIHSFEDIEHYFLKGAGLSPSTYRSYMTSIKSFWEHSKHLHPLMVKGSDIEEWYDDMAKHLDRGTCCTRVAGLRRFFKGVEKVAGNFVSPFTSMDEKLSKKLSRTQKGNRTRPTLTPDELNRLLAWLASLNTVRARQDAAIVRFLSTSAVRSAEFIQLHYGDIDEREDGLFARFVGKGNRNAEQECDAGSLAALRAVFVEQHGREPTLADPLVTTLPWGNTREPAPMNYAVLYSRTRELGAAARAAGVIKRDMAWSPHMWRRCCATLLDRAGMDIKSISLFMRHSDISTTAKHYIDRNERAKSFLAKMLQTAVVA